MTTAASALLRLMWLASPALPVGGFSYSEGLESAVDAGLVHDEASARTWLLDQIELVITRSDGPALADAQLAWARGDTTAAAGVNAWVLATRETAEQRAQCEQMGRSLTEWLKNSPEAADPRVAQLAALPGAPSWPVAYALAGALVQAGPAELLSAFAWGWAENMAQAAMKAVPLGQASAQRLLGALADRIPGAVERARATAPADRQAHAPMLAILSARHEVQYTRLFRS